MTDIYICSCKENGGIYRYIFFNGRLEFKDKTDLESPMYAVKKDGKMYVLLRETDSETHFGGLVSFDIAPDGRLINKSEIVSSKGIVPCHLAVENDDIYIVNYLSGSIVKLPDKVVTHKGKGIHPTRQTEPHTHFTAIDGDNVFCTDLGIDTLFIYNRALNEKHRVKLPDGKGIRHLAVSPDKEYIYCVNELSNDVSVLKYGNEKPVLLETYPAIPDYSGESTAAAIRIKGEYLYISNRGADTISRFKIDGEKLQLIDNTPCLGNSPRDFEIIDGHIFCTNEVSNNVTVFKIEDSGLVPTDISVDIEGPLCVIGG